jgi:hypothetical protein
MEQLLVEVLWEANKITLLIAFLEGESSIIGSCIYIGDLVFGCAIYCWFVHHTDNSRTVLIEEQS